MKKTEPFPRRLWRALASFQFTLVAIVLLMILVALCTFAQTRMGNHEAVQACMRGFFVWSRLPFLQAELPVFPGGALVGLALGVNLTAALCQRFAFTWSQAGLWMTHAGLILLIVGEGSTAALQVETRMALEEGRTVDYTESVRDLELAVSSAADSTRAEVHSIPAALLDRSGPLEVPGLPMTLRIRRYLRSASLTLRDETDPPALATAGIGVHVTVAEQSPRMDGLAAALVEPVIAGQSFGIWLVSPEIGAPQPFAYEGRTYGLSLRPRRHDLPCSITLRKFSHEVYPGTEIPRNFSSLVHLSNPAKHEERDVLIRMNQPLRYEGLTFYQASYGEEGRLSILQVVRNPGWLLPYVSCGLAALGLLLHFGLKLRRSWQRRRPE